MTFNTIKYESKDNIGLITLNRPKVYNAINGQCRTELHKVLDDISDDYDIRALIITGNEKFFCAGADITETKFKTAAEATEFSRNYQTLFRRVADLKKPVIAAVSGFALGGGCELALSCDVVILSENASLGVVEINIASFPAGSGTQILPRLIGTIKAKAMLLSGERVNAKDAYDMGLATKVVPNEECLKEAWRWAETLASKSPSAIRAIKLLVNTGVNMDLSSALIFESESLGKLSTQDDFKEGANAFLEKRKPVFKGD